MNKINLLIVVASLSAIVSKSQAQKFSVYYVSVGSAHYTPDFTQYDAGFPGLPNVEAANTSASEVAAALNKSGAKGTLLTSSKTSFITNEIVYTAIRSTLAQIKREKPLRPFFLFYFCGHGISEGLGWNLLMLPGDYTYDINRRGIATAGEVSLPASYVWDEIHEQYNELPFMIVADCCYEGDDQLPQVVKLKEHFKSFHDAMKLTEESMKIVRVMNEFHEENTMIFSTKPGETVAVVEISDQDKRWVGPMGRRMLKALSKETVTWRQLTDGLTITTDSQTTRGVTFWEGHNKESYRIK